MSKVFLAEHEMMRRRCAIKVLPSKYQADPDLLARFHIEARAIAALDHPHIVRAYDFNKDVRYGRDIHYLVMEFVDGPDLRRLVEEQGPLDFRKAADFICQAADGLAHAHQAGFVHRDIKPANLLVDQNGVLKILDLGLARVTFEGEQPWQTSEGEPSAVGTADYVAPEQVADSRSVDGRADIYSLGHTFYYLLTGRRPFPKSTLVELLMAHRKEQPEPIGKFRPDVPLELIEIVERMTAKEPIRRFQTAREVSDKLQAWLTESAGGGEYSRISALMAAAMRSRQPTEQDAAKAVSKGTEASVLELAAIEDEPQAPTKSPAAENNKTESAKPVTAREQLPSQPRSSHGDSKPTLANLCADVLAELLPDDTVAASQSDPLLMLPADMSRLPYPAVPKFKRQSSPLDILKSPWFWTALVWLVFVVLLLLVLLRSPTSEQPPEHGSAIAGKQIDSEKPSKPADSSPSTPWTTSQEQTETPSPTPKETPSPETAKTPPAQTAEVPVPESTPPPSKEEPAPTEATPKPTPPVESPTPKEEPKETPPKTEKPAAPKPNAAALLAGVKKLSVHIKSSDTDPQSTLNLTIKRQALEAIKQLGIEIEEKDPPALLIEVHVSKTADTFSVVIVAGVVCPGPQDKLFLVWKQNKQIVSMPAGRARQDQVLRMLRKGAKDFFDRFADDVRKARINAKFK